MKQRGAIVSSLIALIAVGGLGSVFLANASPYMTITEVRDASGNNIHVSGTIDHSTVHQNLAKRQATFTISDAGEKLQVLYKGKPQPNLANATTVVVIGKMEGNQFVAHDMMLKCPSKYESTKEVSGSGS
ncbi:MAG: cytochrome c maturation protein CcmE [Methanoregulaceae archaeon]|nr:cytochrome c maturation protein CcmE [Methanoregulaceae archaeon]